MNTLKNTFIALAALSLFAFGCEAVDDEQADVVDMAGLESSIDEAIDGLDADADEELGVDASDPASSDILMELELAPEDATLDRPSRRQMVKRLVRRMAEDEPCALRGIIAGRYGSTEEAEPADGLFGVRAFRRHRRLVARGEGDYTGNDEAPGGSFAGDWVNFEGNTGTLEGDYTPEVLVDDIRLGSFDGSWEPTAAAETEVGGGNIAGVWHPTEDGRGVFVGYWSRCDLDPTHLDETEVE